MLGVGGDVGYWGCEPRIEGIVQCNTPENLLIVLYKLIKVSSLYL